MKGPDSNATAVCMMERWTSNAAIIFKTHRQRLWAHFVQPPTSTQCGRSAAHIENLAGVDGRGIYARLYSTFGTVSIWNSGETHSSCPINAIDDSKIVRNLQWTHQLNSIICDSLYPLRYPGNGLYGMWHHLRSLRQRELNPGRLRFETIEGKIEALETMLPIFNIGAQDFVVKTVQRRDSLDVQIEKGICDGQEWREYSHNLQTRVDRFERVLSDTDRFLLKYFVRWSENVLTITTQVIYAFVGWMTTPVFRARLGPVSKRVYKKKKLRGIHFLVI